jgi:hypothetical protein
MAETAGGRWDGMVLSRVRTNRDLTCIRCGAAAFNWRWLGKPFWGIIECLVCGRRWRSS